MTDPALADAISARAAAVRDRIGQAALRAGRDPGEVTLVAVTKTRPLATVRAAVAAGLRDLGENRVGELVAKSDALPGASDGGDVRWHLIGSLQRNKARDAAARADLFHALDSRRLADALDKKAADAVPDLLAYAAGLEHVRPVGLMGMAAFVDDARGLERVVRPAFRRLRALYDAAPDLSVLSMGMSGDYEVAVEEGATHVRVGTALFGPRDG